MLWWIIALAMFVSALIDNINTTFMIVSGLFAIAGAITYVGNTIGSVLTRKGDNKNA